MLLLPTAELGKHPFFATPERPTPLDAGFTDESFRAGFEDLEPEDPRAVKLFMISKPIEKTSFLGGASYFCPRCQV